MCVRACVRVCVCVYDGVSSMVYLGHDEGEVWRGCVSGVPWRAAQTLPASPPRSFLISAPNPDHADPEG